MKYIIEPIWKKLKILFIIIWKIIKLLYITLWLIVQVIGKSIGSISLVIWYLRIKKTDHYFWKYLYYDMEYYESISDYYKDENGTLTWHYKKNTL